jgi:hypothetical protein
MPTNAGQRFLEIISKSLLTISNGINVPMGMGLPRCYRPALHQLSDFLIVRLIEYLEFSSFSSLKLQSPSHTR